MKRGCLTLAVLAVAVAVVVVLFGPRLLEGGLDYQRFFPE